MATHDGCPCLTLALFLLVRITAFIADGSGIDKHFCSLQSHQPGCLRIPLVPADKHAQPSHTRVDRMKTEVTRCEVELFIVGRIIRDVHLPVLACYATVFFYHYSRVVI